MKQNRPSPLLKPLCTMLFFCITGALAAAEFSSPRNVKISGELGQRIQLTEKRLLSAPFDLDLIAQDVARRPELTRRFEEYEGDVSGRTLGAWSYLSLLTHQRPAKLDSIFERILPCQKPEGYFGIDQSPINWDEWGRQTFGHGRLLGGLVQYYQLTGDLRALSAAVKLGDYFIRSIPLWTTAFPDNPWSNTNPLIDWQSNTSNRQHFVKTHMTSILESLMMLHQVAPKPELLKAAAAIIELFPEFGQYHSHSYLNTMTGMAMLYDQTRDHAVFSRLYNLYWQKVKAVGAPADGGICEFFPEDLRTEGCSVTDWIRLNLFMWKITQDNVYLDEAENGWYNALNFHQTGNGAFGHALHTPTGYAGDYSEAWWCCTMHGLWAFDDLVNFMATARNSDVWINFFAPSEFDLAVKGSSIHFSVATAYPQDGLVTIRCDAAQPTALTLHLRIPQWARNFTVEINDKSATGVKKSGEFIIDRTWKKGDRVTLRLPLALRLVDAKGNNLLESREVSRAPHAVSFYYGPLMLAVASQSNTFPELILFDAAKNYHVKGNGKPFELSAAHFMIPAMQNGFESTIVLTPLSEQTSYDTWSAEWRHFERNGEKPIMRVPVQTTLPVRIKK